MTRTFAILKSSNNDLEKSIQQNYFIYSKHKNEYILYNVLWTDVVELAEENSIESFVCGYFEKGNVLSFQLVNTKPRFDIVDEIYSIKKNSNAVNNRFGIEMSSEQLMKSLKSVFNSFKSVKGYKTFLKQSLDCNKTKSYRTKARMSLYDLKNFGEDKQVRPIISESTREKISNDFKENNIQSIIQMYEKNSLLNYLSNDEVVDFIDDEFYRNSCDCSLYVALMIEKGFRVKRDFDYFIEYLYEENIIDENGYLIKKSMKKLSKQINPYYKVNVFKSIKKELNFLKDNNRRKNMK